MSGDSAVALICTLALSSCVTDDIPRDWVANVLGTAFLLAMLAGGLVGAYGQIFGPQIRGEK